MKYFNEEIVPENHLDIIRQFDEEWQSYEGRPDVNFVSKTEVQDNSGIDPVVLSYVIDKVPTFAVVQPTEDKERIKRAVLEEAGIPTENMLHGLLMSIESNGVDEQRMQKAFDDWIMYYEQPAATNFNCIVCHLIVKADSDNLFRLSKAFPEHVRVFVENQLLKDVPAEKLSEGAI